MTSNELLYGFEGPLPEQKKLTAGPFTMIYENGSIRHIKYGDNEIIRMIHMSLRDKNWGTYKPILEEEKLDILDHSFSIRFRCRYEENKNTCFVWEVVINGSDEGKIDFAISGTAITDFWKNRAGFCVLHPIKNTAGQPLKITHADGSVETSSFPLNIAPQNPFVNIKNLQWNHKQHQYIIETTGDTFEMEDHRNWTDASFKTFCTPLSLPFPVLVKRGQVIEQKISFYPAETLPAIQSIVTELPVTITMEEEVRKKMPGIGTSASTEIKKFSEKLIAVLKEIKYDHYCIDIKTAAEGWKQDLTEQLYIARLMGLPLFVIIYPGTDYNQDLSAFTEMITGYETSIKYMLILGSDEPVTSQQIIDWAGWKVKELFPEVLPGIGTPANFTELNRNRKSINNIDFVSYAIHPQAHAFDNLSLIENLQSQGDTVSTAMLLYPGARICISPVTLRQRINPYAHNKADRELTNEQKADPRQRSLWGAGWTMASIKYLTEAGASFINYFQTAGAEGICGAEGELYPVGALLRLILQEEATIIKTGSNEPLVCTSLLLETSQARYLFLANHTSETQTIKIPLPITNIDNIGLFPSKISHSKIAATDKIELAPWQVVRLS
ncbi:MAG: hypothetical protein WKI04_09440 [Ferruginibacter sp.]